MCQEIHSTVIVKSKQFEEELSRINYVTPTSYLELLGMFNKLVASKKVEFQTSRNRTKTGLDKVDKQLYHGIKCSIYIFIKYLMIIFYGIACGG